MKYFIFLCFASLVFSVPNINLPSFDVRERFRDCWNWGYNQLYNVFIVYSGCWRLLFKLFYSA